MDSMDVNLSKLPGDSGGQRSLVCYSPWDGKESDTTQQLKNNNKSAYKGIFLRVLQPSGHKIAFQVSGEEFWHTVNPEGSNEVKQKHRELLQDWKWLKIEGMLELEAGNWSVNQVGEPWDSWEPSALRLSLLPEYGVQAGPLIALHSRDEGNSYITASLWGPSRLTAGNPWAQIKQSSMLAVISGSSDPRPKPLPWSEPHPPTWMPKGALNMSPKLNSKASPLLPKTARLPFLPSLWGLHRAGYQVHGSRAHNVNPF